MQLLSSTEDKFFINKGDDKTKIPTDEFLDKKHARFVDARAVKQMASNLDSAISMSKQRSYVSSPLPERLPSTNLASLKKQQSRLVEKAPIKENIKYELLDSPHNPDIK